MADLSKLSGPKLKALIAKRETEHMALVDWFIANGHGQMRGSDIRRKQEY